MPPRLRTFISAERLMAKTVVSAVKPGGQTLEVCPSGFLIWAVALAGAFAAGVRDRAAASCFDCRNGCVLFIDNERLPHSFQSRWHIPFAPGGLRNGAKVGSGKALCQVTVRFSYIAVLQPVRQTL